ncbi:hemolytic lectin [Mycena vulgaris]|nr:hemolytic lectin [Mycena vulgaris]
MTSLYVPPEGIFFRLRGYVSNQVLFSRKEGESKQLVAGFAVVTIPGDPSFGATGADASDEATYFSLIKGTGAKAGLFLIKARQSGWVLFSRVASKPFVSHVPGNGQYPDNWFKLDPGKDLFVGMTRLVVPATKTVVVLRDKEVPNNVTNLTEIYSDQYFKFEYEDMLVERIEYDLKLGRVLATTPCELISQVLRNPANAETTMGFAFSKAWTHTSSFEQTTGFEISTGAKFTVGIPVIGGTEFHVDTTLKKEWKVGTETSFEKTYTTNGSVKVGPNASVRAIATLTIGTLVAPYTLFLSSKSKGVKTQIRGLWRGESSWQMELSTEDVP